MPDPSLRQLIRGRFVVPAVVAAVALAPIAAAGVPDDPAGRRTADQPRDGYPLRHDGTAAGDWIGSRTLGGRVVFRIDPARKPAAGAFGPARWVADLDGSGPVDVNRARTRRAAWILAKYGTYRSKTQAAAVEVALDALLHGGRYDVTGAATARRLAQTADPPTILGLADYMLTSSRALAGPYLVDVRTDGAVIGEDVVASVRVTAARSGEPIPSLPVEMGLSGRVATGTTDDGGAVELRVRAPHAGPQTVSFLVRLLPSDRLLVRRPQGGKGSRVVVAGRKQDRALAALTAVRARPTVRLTTRATSRVRQPLPGRVVVAAGYPSGRSAALTVHGPFAAGSAGDCSAGSTLGSAHALEVTADGSYAVPQVSIATPGVYTWGIALAGDRFNLPASACGAAVTVRATPTATAEPTKDRIAPGGSLRGRLRVTGLDAAYAGTARALLYGPFDTRADARCTEGRLARARGVEVTGPTATVTTPAITLQRAGVYTWRVAVPPGPLSLATQSACAAPGSFFTVR